MLRLDFFFFVCEKSLQGILVIWSWIDNSDYKSLCCFGCELGVFIVLCNGITGAMTTLMWINSSFTSGFPKNSF